MHAFPASPSAFPILSVVYNASGHLPVILNLSADWERTGECHIAYLELAELVETARLLNFIVDAVADVLLAEKKKWEGGEVADQPDIPF